MKYCNFKKITIDDEYCYYCPIYLESLVYTKKVICRFLRIIKFIDKIKLLKEILK